MSERCDKCNRKAEGHPLGLFCCPLCGSEADIDRIGEPLVQARTYHDYFAAPRVQIRCMAACCELTLADHFEHRAIAHWNNREPRKVK